ncbi:MAG: tetratricopeptide repeat protein [Chloroflexi bacterium]|nr:tetratricopeptide repeat protein [Chloroflexota bacterium]
MQIVLRLLAEQPVITLDGKPLPLHRKDALHLLIYTAEQWQESYQRDSLNALLFGEGSASQRLREALHWLNRALREAGFPVELFPAQAPGQRSLQFARAHVWVDVHEFSGRARQVLAQPEHSSDMEVESAVLAALDLYQDHFLNDMTFDSDALALWHEQRQQALADLRHQLLERLVQTHIYRGELARAKQIAEMWQNSLNAGFVPLQYLMWLALTLRLNSAAQQVLAQLQRYQDEEPTFFGTDVETWREVIDSDKAPSLLLLRLHTVSQVNAATLLPDGAYSRRQQTLDLVERLVESYTPRVIGLTGLPGAGKSQFIEQVASLVRQAQPRIEIVLIKVTAETDFETLLNDALDQLRFQQLRALPYAVRQRRFKQVVHEGQTLVIVDDATAFRLSDAEFVHGICDLFEQTELILVARSLPGDRHYPIELEGFSQDRVHAYLAEQVPQISNVDSGVYEAVTRITGGLPLAMRWLIGFLRDERFQLTAFVKALSQQFEGGWTLQTAVENYDVILNWLWYQLLPDERNVLYAFSLFDAARGAGLEDIVAIAALAFPMKPERLQEKIARLVKLGLLQPLSAAEPRWGMHPITDQFMKDRVAQAESQFSATRQAFTARFLSYASQHADDFAALDREQNNLLKMFDMVLDGRQPPARPDQAVATLNRVFSYFKTRGLYARLGQLLENALTIVGVPDQERVHLLARLGENIFNQGQYDAVEQWYQSAWELAQQVEFTEAYGNILSELGRLYIMRGKYDAAKASFDSALDAVAAHGQWRIEAQIRANLGVVAYHLGQYDEAERILTQVTQVLRAREGYDSDLGVQGILQFVESFFGTIDISRKALDPAEGHFLRSLQAGRMLNSPERLARDYINMGVLNYSRGEFDAAIDYFTQGSVVAEYLQHGELMNWCLWNIGALYVVKSQFDRARGKLLLAQRQATELRLIHALPNISLWLGILHLRQFQLDPAQIFFEASLTRSALVPRTTALAVYGLALVCRYRHDLPMQDTSIEAASQIAQMMDSLDPTHLNLSALQRADLERAQSYFQTALVDTPGIDGYHIIPALESWLSRQQPA